MDIKLEAEGREEVIASLERGLDLYQRGLKLQMTRALQMLQGAIQQNVRRRSGLNVVTGALLNSIQYYVTEEDGEVVGYVGSYGVPYAAVHEFGHNFPARMVFPRFKKALHWVGSDGRPHFSRGHQIPAYRVPARPYIRPAIEEQSEMIFERFRLFINESLSLEG